MDASPDTDGRRRTELIEELYGLYGKGTLRMRLRFARKKYAWVTVTGGARAIKRGFDLLVALSALLLLSPLFLAVTAAIRLTDNGPVLYWQKRVGKWGREFPFPKFRSMVVNADTAKDAILDQSDHEESITFKMKKDPRITGIGRIIRKLSIDELPQLWCVLKGEMSLVGPRPPLPREVALYTLADRRRLDVTPGLTSIWAVSGRGDIPFDRQVELDLQYIESRSIATDLKILLKTIPAVLFGRGAY
ncbi:sugar transferase [Desulfoluna butyratoxydans]|uniref:Bacterial sugar transferase n=1 Tax=Desulfoluna butyratoxydans TaxID=231438 RepID=A0A4U8YT15_9BACT|nr:sugar transferase [Desulfoluna butyratoxydans]VFQ46499.1 bacterial sugar transferase [Desulfoluna butyratoxydans]